MKWCMPSDSKICSSAWQLSMQGSAITRITVALSL